MKYRKLILKHLTKKSNNSHVAVAVIAGLAVGAVISLLFAKDSGENTRKLISDNAKELRDNAKEHITALRNKLVGAEEEEELIAETDVPHFIHKPIKKRKSDIKELIDEAHALSNDETQS